jgi:hypothetical protein
MAVLALVAAPTRPVDFATRLLSASTHWVPGGAAGAQTGQRREQDREDAATGRARLHDSKLRGAGPLHGSVGGALSLASSRAPSARRSRTSSARTLAPSWGPATSAAYSGRSRV